MKVLSLLILSSLHVILTTISHKRGIPDWAERVHGIARGGEESIHLQARRTCYPDMCCSPKPHVWLENVDNIAIPPFLDILVIV